MTDELRERVARLSTAKLALLNLRLGERTATPTQPLAGPGRVPAATSIPRLPREVDADVTALERLDELSDAEVDQLLRQVLQQDAAPPPCGDPTEDRIPNVPRNREAKLLARLDGMSDAEVDSLLDELMPDRRAVAE